MLKPAAQKSGYFSKKTKWLTDVVDSESTTWVLVGWKRANQKLGFVKRNLRGSPVKCKATAYITLIRSGLEYAAIIWDPYLKKDIDLLEKVQRRSARWVKSDYKWTSSVTNLLTELKWAELKTRRKDIRLSFLYKIINSKVEICLSDLDTYIVDRTTRRGASSGSGFNQKLFLPRAKTAVRRHSFIIRSVPEWNTLPLDTLQSSTIDAFKSKLDYRKCL